MIAIDRAGGIDASASEVALRQRTVLWRRLDAPGLEACTLEERPPGWTLRGWVTTVMAGATTRIDYTVVCDREWRTRRAEIAPSCDGEGSRMIIEGHPDGRWWEQGARRGALDGCTDVDMNVTASTNLLPIRRCSPRLGESVEILAAWVRFPERRIEPLGQRYTRLRDRRYRYESLSSRFVAEFDVDEDGLVVDYPGFRVRRSAIDTARS